MFKLEPPRSSHGAQSPAETPGKVPGLPKTSGSAAIDPLVPVALGSSHHVAPDLSMSVAHPRESESHPLNDPFFRGWLGGILRGWFAYFEGERGTRFWGGAAGLLLCLVILRAVWAFGSEQPSTHWDRENRPQAVATDGSRLAAMDVVVHRRPAPDEDAHLLLVTGVVENQGNQLVHAAKVAASFGDRAPPAMTWAGHWLSPGDLIGERAQATMAALQKQPENATIAPGHRLPFVLVGKNVPPNTPFQLHVAAGPSSKQTP